MRIDRNTFPGAWEGGPFSLLSAAITLALGIFSLILPTLLAFIVTLFIIYFFRNPQRSVPGDKDTVLAPADGVIIYMGNAYETHLEVEMLKISIFMSVLNVHVNRVPFSGRVLDVFYKQGKFLDARDDKATFENEQSGIILETEKGLKMVFVQVAGLIARRIVSYPAKGDWLKRGERYGLIRFGSRVDVYLPKSTDIRVSVGDKTTAGETVLGCLK